MEQSIDAAGTEAKEGKEPREKKAKGSIDWAPIRKAWSRGIPVAQIAKEHGVKEMTIYSQANRHRWPKREAVLKGKIATVDPKELAQKAVERSIEKAVMEQAPAINNAIREKLNAWFQRVLTTSDKLQSHIDAMADGRLEAEEVKTLSSSLETVDRIARRTFGLDSPAGSPVSVFSVQSPAISCPVIDVETIPEATPASSPQ
jgi:transposase-like protein